MNFKLNRLLHALAGELVTREHAHNYIKATADKLFGKTTLKELTDDEAKKIAERIRKEINNQRLGIYNAKNEGIDLITTDQIILIKKIQHNLSWSDEYLRKLISQRYDEEQITTMPKWKAIRLIMYLIKREKAHALQS